MADLTPLNLADSFESFLSLCFCTFLSNFNSEDKAWLSSSQTLVANLNFHIAKYYSRGIKEFSNGLSTMVQQEY